MQYVKNNLTSGEEIIHEGKIHWIVFLHGIIISIISILITIENIGAKNGNSGVLFLFIGAGCLINSYIKRATTELAVTSKRVIVKTGLIRRDTIEINNSKVESFIVEQGIFGRFLDYGNIIVKGTGGGRTCISKIEKPLEFRKEAMKTIDHRQS